MRSVAISADGEYIAAGSADDKVYLFDKDSDTPLWSYATGNYVNSVAISADGEYLAAGSWDNKIYLFDKDSSTPLWSYATWYDVRSVAISANGEHITAGSEDYKVYLFDDRDGDGYWGAADAFPNTARLHAWWQVLPIVLVIGAVGTTAGFTLWSRRAIGGADRALRGLERDGVLLSPARATLDRARRKWRRFNYPGAVALARKAQGEGSTLTREREALVRQAARLRERLAELRTQGVATAGLEAELVRYAAVVEGEGE